MKTIPFLLLVCLLTVSAHAEFRVWTRNDGKTSEIEVVTEHL